MRTTNILVAVTALGLIGVATHGLKGEAKVEAIGHEKSAALAKVESNIRALEDALERNAEATRRAQATAESGRHDAMAGGYSEAKVLAEPDRGVDAEDKASKASEEGEGSDPVLMAATLDERFYEERSDPEWIKQALGQAQAVGALLPDGSRATSLECRASMCRLEMQHGSSDGFRAFVTQALIEGGGGWTGPFLTVVTSDPSEPGPLDAVAYLARDGTELDPGALN